MKLDETVFLSKEIDGEMFEYYIDSDLIASLREKLLNYYGLGIKKDLIKDEFYLLNGIYRYGTNYRNIYGNNGKFLYSDICLSFPVIRIGSNIPDFRIYADSFTGKLLDSKVFNTNRSMTIEDALTSLDNSYIKYDLSEIKKCVYVHEKDNEIRTALFRMIYNELYIFYSENSALKFKEDMFNLYNINVDATIRSSLFNEISKRILVLDK